MKGLGYIKAKGKLTYFPGCGCCVFYNRKKYADLNDKIDVNSLQHFINSGENSSYYPPLIKLFGENLEISIDHPTGEDVLFLNGKFKGYASDWLKMIDFAEKSNIKFHTPEELEEIYYENIFRNGVV